MPIPSSGQISIGDIQSEFAGADPAALGNYYRGGSLVPSYASSTIPTVGKIGIGNFYNSFLPVSNGTIIGAIQTIAVRNYLTSQCAMSRGNETNLGYTIDLAADSAGNRYTTSVWGQLNFNPAASQTANMLKTTSLTILARNWGVSTSYPTIYVNGGVQPVYNLPPSLLQGGYCFTSIATTNFGFKSLSNVIGNFLKGSANACSLQEMYVFPGTWNVVSQNSNATGAITVNVMYGDVVLILNTQNADADPVQGTFSGVGRGVLMDRYDHWYSGWRELTVIPWTNGQLTYNNNPSKEIIVLRLAHG